MRVYKLDTKFKFSYILDNSILFFTTGIYYLYKETYENLNLDLIVRNFLISGSLIFLVGSVSSTFKLFNFVSYYFLGLNKFGMRSLESIEGILGEVLHQAQKEWVNFMLL